MLSVKEDQPRGVVDRSGLARVAEHRRYLPPDELTGLVEHFWSVQWRLSSSEHHEQMVLPHPSVHLVLESGTGRLVGVKTRRFVRRLSGIGAVFGIKFYPGAFHALLPVSQSRLTNHEFMLDRIPVCEWSQPLANLARTGEAECMVANITPLLAPYARQLEQDANITLARKLVDAIRQHPEIGQVNSLARFAGVGARTLQRLFRDYVGVSPKWVIKRYRMHEALARAELGESVDWGQLAQDLGYHDQAHFIRDFYECIGTTPARFRHSLS